MLNPDNKKYAIRFRKGKPVLFERENLEAIKRWRQKRNTLPDAQNCPIRAFGESDKGEAPPMSKNLFGGESDE